MKEGLYDDFLSLFCEKNSDGTKNLRLKGNEMIQRIGRRIDAVDMSRVADYMQNHLEIESLDLSYNEIGDVGLEIFCEDYFYYRNNLKHLNIMHCDITAKGLRKLHTVRKTLVLETLRVAGNHLEFQGNRFVAMILRDTPHLRHLDCGDTNLTPGAVELITHVVQRNNSLQCLDLSRVVPESSMQRLNPGDLMHGLISMLEFNTSLVELHLQKCEFDGHDVETLLEGLTRNHTLLLLDLGFNRIHCYGLEQLAKWIRTCPKLQALNVAGCSIRDLGITALSFAMPFSKIRLLDITKNKITDEGMINFLHSLKKPFELTFFYFWGNSFGHNTNEILKRMLDAGTLNQENIDVKLYEVHGIISAAYSPTNHYKHRYYCVTDTAVPCELKIKRNKVETEATIPKAQLNYKFYDRYPPVEKY